MQRKLPSRPNLEHLKSQAKDLLAAQRSGDVEALARIRAAVPAFANQSDDDLRKGPFALHDAQSAIAREYGFPSWAALRAHLSHASEGQAPDELALIRTVSGQALPAELDARVREALTRRGAAAAKPTPPTVPVLPLRNAVAFPGALVPIDVARPSTLRGIDAAQEHVPAFLAVFSQRASDIERPAFDDFHALGCLCNVLFVHRLEQSAWILLEGVRWVTLEALVQVDPYYLAQVADTAAAADDASEDDELARRLRERARQVAATLPETVRHQALALIDATRDTTQLADLVMANLEATVDEKVAYARETDLALKVESVITRLDAELAKQASAG
jgi:Lon protease-like protein